MKTFLRITTFVLLLTSTATAQSDLFLGPPDIAPARDSGLRISGDRIVTLASKSGLAIVEFDGNDWIQRGDIPEADAEISDFDVLDDRIVILRGDEIQVLELLNDEWAQGSVWTFDPEAATDTPRCERTSLGEDRLALSCPGHPGPDGVLGQVEVYAYKDGTWATSGSILPPTTDANSTRTFGESISMLGDRLLISNQLENSEGRSTVTASAYEWSGSEWVYVTEIGDPDAEASKAVVKLTADRAAIAVAHVGDAGSESRVYVSDWKAGEQPEESVLIQGDEGDSTEVADFDIAISGEHVVTIVEGPWRLVGFEFGTDQTATPPAWQEITKVVGISYTEVEMTESWIVLADESGGDRTIRAFDRTRFFAPVGTSGELTASAGGFQLGAAWPNPFNQETTVQVAVPEAGPVVVEIFDILGRSQGVLVDATLPQGIYDVKVNASLLSAGTYIIRARAVGQTAVRTISRH